MADAFGVLKNDHNAVKAMLAELEVGSLTGEQRKRLADRLVMEESKHEAVEEMYFWPAVRERVAGGDDLAERAISQETEGKGVLDQIDKAGEDDTQLRRLIAQFATAGRAHIAYEEEQVWPRLTQVMGAADLERLGEQLEQAKKTAPTRPHPHTPPNPGTLKAAGPAAALVDRVRDAASGRG